MKDAFYRELEVGDYVFYAPGTTTGYSTSVRYGVIVSFTPKMVKVDMWSGRTKQFEPHHVALAPDRLIKAEKLNVRPLEGI